MDNLEKFFNFLEKHEGKTMNIGYHLPIGAIYNTIHDWTLNEEAVSTSINCENQTYEFYHEDLQGINEDPESMNVFIGGKNEGFEIYFKGSVVGFEILE